MATSVRDFRTQDSDEVRSMHCEHCSILIDKEVLAEGFCADCSEYMCKTCLRYHNMYMSGHSIQDQDTMPQEFCLENCENHPKRLIKYYCSQCQTFACSQCQSKDHSSCSETHYLPNLVNGIEKSKEYTEVTKSLEKLLIELDAYKEEAARNIIYVDVQYKRAISTISEHKENLLGEFKKRLQEKLDDFDRKINETVEKLKAERRILVEQIAEMERKLAEEIDNAAKNVENQIEKMKNEDKSTLREVGSKIEPLLSDLIEQSNCLNREEKVGNKCKLFILMKQARKIVDNGQKLFEELLQSNKCYLYVVTPEKINIHDTSQASRKHFALRMLSSCKQERLASFRKNIALQDIKLPTSCLVLHGHLLLTCECFPFLYTFNTLKHDKIVCEKLQMQSEPWAMAQAGRYRVAVTFPHEELVRLIDFDKSMEIINTNVINVDGPCYGVECSDEMLIISYNFVFQSKSPRVQILNMVGEVQQSIDQDSERGCLFSDPHHLALSPDNTILYVSDFKNDTVTAMTLNGKVIAVYEGEQFKGPCQVVVDWSGTVYVCCYRSGNVYQLTSELKMVKILLGFTKDVGCPTGLAFCPGDDLLYVGLENSEFLKVYNISV